MAPPEKDLGLLPICDFAIRDIVLPNDVQYELFSAYMVCYGESSVVRLIIQRAERTR